MIIIKTYHVGGLNPLNRCKTLADAIAKAKDDDVIAIHKTVKESVSIDKAIIIQGNGNKFICEQGVLGINATKHLVIENLNIICETRSNAIASSAKLELHDVNLSLKGPVREFYPLLWIKSGSLFIKGGSFINLQVDEGAKMSAENASFKSYYGGDIELKTKVEQSHILGESVFVECELSSISLAKTKLNNCTLGKFVSIVDGSVNSSVLAPRHSEPVVKIDKEYPSGPLSAKSSNLVCVYVDGSVVFDNLMYDGDGDFLGVYSNGGSVILTNTNNTTFGLNNRLDNATFNSSDVVDESFWELNKTTTAFVRSKINSNSKQKTAMEKLDELVGLDSVKSKIKSILNNIRMNQKSNNKDFGFSYHMVFAGDPGTGKTSVSRIVAEALFEIGAIPENKCTNATVDTLVKGYVGQTADNVRKILDEALGGVLFIDEAYQLAVKDGQNTFNDEALSVIIRYMEDHRDELVVIAAGYNKEMKDFLASNIGLARRFQWVQFDDYSPEEMADIFELIRRSNEVEYDDPKLQRAIPIVFKKLTDLNLSLPDANGRVTNGGNGGLVRNVFQKILSARNDRVVSDGGTENITKQDIEVGFREEVTNTKNRSFL